jgi:hypothetical protein
MAYIYRVSFDITPSQMSELEIGASLERVLGYLRALLPGDDGFITAQAMYSLDSLTSTHVVFESKWDLWEDLERHCATNLAEDKVLSEFAPHVVLNDLAVRLYREVS